MRKLLLVTGGIIFLAFVIRLINLTILPVFADEAIYIRWSQVMRAESTLRFLPLSDGKQPLYMWATIPFLKIFSDPLFAGRFLSVLTGLGTLTGVMTLSYLLFKSKKATVFSGIFYAISPYAFFFDRMSLADSMLSMFCIWAVIFTILAIRYVRFDSAMLAGFSLGGAALTKSPALFIALLLPLTALTKSFPKKKRLLNIATTVAMWLITYVIAFGLYNILRLGPEFHMIGIRNMDYVHPVNHIFESPLDPLLPHFDRALQWIRILGPDLLLVFIGIGAALNFRKYKNVVLLLLAFVFIPIAIQSAYAKVFTARYIFFTIPYLYILAGSTFITLYKFKWQKVVYILLSLYLVHAFWFNWQLMTNPENAPLPSGERSGYLEEWSAGTGIKEASEYILQRHNENPDQPIVVGTEGYFGTLPDGLQIYLEKIPNITVIGIGLGINQVPPQLVESAESGAETYLVANTSRLNFDGEFSDYGLEIVGEYKKANRADGTFDYFYLFKVNPSD